jgi:OmpA-OmpF porin, OOP family
MKRTRICIASITAALFALPAAAQEPGFYAGISAGRSKFNNQCDGIPSGASCDENATTWKLFGGYQFSRNLAAELGYSNELAKASASGFGVTADLKASALEAVVIPSVPLGDFSLFAKLGIYAADTKGTSNVGISASDSNSSWTAGLGAGYNFSRNLGARLEWQRYNKVGGDNTGKADVDVFNVGLLYRF